MPTRRTDGDETWYRLINWTKGQKASERLTAHILQTEGFKSIDPSHPLGGKDGLKDFIIIKDNMKWIGAAYFPRGQKTFSGIKKKFKNDLKGVSKNSVTGMAFVTNQELSLKDRKELKGLGRPYNIEIYHLERIAHIVDTPINYGIRLEFIDIEMTREEQLSFFASRDNQLLMLSEKIECLMMDYHGFKKAMRHDEDLDVFKERTRDEVESMIDEFFDKVWYDRHQMLEYRVQEKGEHIAPDIWKGAIKAAREVEKKYGKENLGPYGDFEWGMLNGKLSALRWLIGFEWDMLDT